MSRALRLPSIRTAAAVVALFGGAVLLTREFEAPIRELLSQHPQLGVLVFIATSVIAVLAPMLTNLPLVPVAVLAWGPAWTAAMLLAGWVVGSALSFALGRYAQGVIIRRFPSVNRYTDIDRLIHPNHRIASLVLLRMSFPVDVLSYALGLFSRETTFAQTAVSTALGGAPFAVLFALFPALPTSVQLIIFGASTLVFLAYLGWVLRLR